MIISKVDKAKQAYMSAVKDVAEVLVTKRGSKEARDELSRLRDYSATTDSCSYCGGGATPRSARHTEACSECGKMIDKMLLLKSRITLGTDDPGLVKQLLDGYGQFTVYTPYALRGATGCELDVLKALDTLNVAALNYKLEVKAARRREAAFNLEARRKDEIRTMLIQCGMEDGSDELEQRVDEIYYAE